MELYTPINITKGTFPFAYTKPITLLGSCFAESIGKKLEENKFSTDINPFGTLYNPATIAFALRQLADPEPFTSSDLFEYEGIYHSFFHHSRFSSASETECLKNINDRQSSSSLVIKEAERVIITFGTAWVYELKSTGLLVSNCHKLPEKLFARKMLSVQDIMLDWGDTLQQLWEQNPAIKILFTVSPIRHWKDGAHGNQLSKATLLLAIDRLQKEYPDRIAYFPAYEIMMDELRDYRFYADDMLHPSPQAVEYIWQRFAENMLSAEAQEILSEWSEIQKALNHKPFRPEGEGYKQFISQTLLKMKRLNEKFPYFDCRKEIELIEKKF